MPKTSNREIVRFLASKSTNAGLVDQLKIKYRPFICPFADLLEFAEGAPSVFDVGCGSGQFCGLVSKFTSAGRIMGIEISKTLVENARQVNEEFSGEKSLKFEEFDGEHIPEEIHDYDLVYMIDVFHHIPPKQQVPFMRQLFQKMRSGATLVFKDIDAGNPLVICNKVHDIVFSGEIGNEISFLKAADLLEEIGFRISKKFRKTVFTYPHFFIVCRK